MRRGKAPPQCMGSRLQLVCARDITHYSIAIAGMSDEMLDATLDKCCGYCWIT